MDQHRRRFLLLTLSGMALASAGCTLPKRYARRRYEETVSSVLVSEDGKKLVFVGKKYHYIFDTPEVILRTLRGPFHSQVRAFLHNFYVEEKGQITGDFRLLLDNKASEENKIAAAEAGYRASNSGKDMIVEGTLKGMRYRSDGVEIKGDTESLNKNYSVFVEEDRSVVEQALLTPIRVAVDGTLMIGLMGLGFAALLGNCGLDMQC